MGLPTLVILGAHNIVSEQSLQARLFARPQEKQSAMILTLQSSVKVAEFSDLG